MLFLLEWTRFYCLLQSQAPESKLGCFHRKNLTIPCIGTRTCRIPLKVRHLRIIGFHSPFNGYFNGFYNPSECFRDIIVDNRYFNCYFRPLTWHGMASATFLRLWVDHFPINCSWRHLTLQNTGRRSWALAQSSSPGHKFKRLCFSHRNLLPTFFDGLFFPPGLFRPSGKVQIQPPGRQKTACLS